MMAADRELAIGLDVGTGGARAVAVALDGTLVAEGRAPLPTEAMRVDGPRVEQDPQAWIRAAEDALGRMIERLPRPHRVIGVSVDATSGTFLLVDAQHRPLTAGIMYNDQRATDVVDEVAESLGPDLQPYGIRIAASFALAKLVHWTRHEPSIWQQAARVVHQTDWIVGMLCGRYDVTDVSTALKTGVDPGRLAWPEAIERLGVPTDCLPQVVLSGTIIGEVTEEASERTGLPAGTPVIAGCTDGTAGCLASGAKHVGDLNVTLGTTLVFKAIAETPLQDPEGVLYNHRHPAGGYLPGAASSTGGEWIDRWFAGQDLQDLNRQARSLVPTGRTVYPLIKSGERFPFACPEARGFGLEEIEDQVERFAAGLEGVAFLERMGVERLERLGLTVGPVVYATGGGAAGTTWLTIRAAVNRRTYWVPEHPECAMGAAILAATPFLGSCQAAIARLVRTGQSIEPDPRLAAAYEEPFGRFRTSLQERGWL
ncbi:MAG: FGGY-family carbohydrate kinase [Planctomycetes bacterium]|nr:FGGY-family carbohydrate kinase [Planctomycetota bacterium]